MNLEFYIRLKDMMSSGLAKIASTAQSSFSKVQGQVDRVTGRNKVLSQSFDEISRQIAKTEQTIRSSNIPSQIRAARRELDQLQKLQNKHAGNMGSASSGGGGSMFGAVLGGNLMGQAISRGLGAAKDALGAIFGGGMQTEKNLLGLETFLGENGAKEAYANIQKDAAQTPFGTESLLSVNRALISTGLSAQAARKDTMNLANAIAATGGGDDELSRMAANMQQIKNVGVATAADIKQFGMAGVNIYQLLADATGKSIEEVREMDVSYNLLSKAFEKAASSGGIYEGALGKLSKSQDGKLNTIWDNIKLNASKLGLAFKPITDKVLDLFGGITDKAPALLESLMPIVNFFNELPIEEMFNKVTSTFREVRTALAPVFEALKPLFISLWETIWPLFEQIRQFTVHLLVKLGPTLTYIANIASKILGPAFKGIGIVLGWLLELVSTLIDWITPLLQGIAGVVSWIVDAADNLLGGKKRKPKTNPASVTASDIGGSKVTDTPVLSNTPVSDNSVAKDVTSAGPRVINIYGVKFADNINIHETPSQSGMDQFESRMDEYFMRLLNSGAKLQGS